MVHVYVRTMVRTYVRTYNVMSQLSDWKRAHMCSVHYIRTYVRTHVYVPWYHGTMVHVYHKMVLARVPGYRGTMYVLQYHYGTYGHIICIAIRTMVPLVRTNGTMVHVYVPLVLRMLCHNFLFGKGHTCALRTT